MFFVRKRIALGPAIALLVACTFSSACTAWHTTSLQPQRFSAEKSPEQARLTFSDGSRMTARHPVLVGDSLVWAQRTAEAPRDPARRAVLAGDIRKVEVHEVDAGRTIGLVVVVVGGVAFAIKAIVDHIAQSI